MTQQNWRDKYLDALDAQEALELKAKAQSDLLRRLLINLGAALSGLDRDLDGSLVTLKEKIRGGTGQDVVSHMQNIEHCVRAYDQRRASYQRMAKDALCAVLNDMTSLALHDDVLSQVTGFKREFNKQDIQLPKLAETLSTFSKLHSRVIHSAKAPKESLWQRIRGGGKLQFPEQVGATLEVNPKPEAGQSSEVIFEQALDVHSWDVIHEQINAVLVDILDSMDEAQRSTEAWQRAKMRLQKSMDWHQLVETLENLRDILQARSNNTDESISAYLTQVNVELQEICERLGVSVEAEYQHELAVSALGQAVTHRMKEMKVMLDGDSEDLEGLKQNISLHLDAIGSALVEFKKKQAEERPISEELKALIEKVKLIEQESENTKQLLVQEQYRATHDALTELPNRDSYNSKIKEEWESFKRYQRPLCIAICDIDHFKTFNDQYGHQVGDRVLRIIAKSLRKRLRSVDFVARYGGEEFVVIMPETKVQDANKVLDNARATISDVPFRLGSEPVKVSFSCGVTQFTIDDTIDSAFARADEALYEAKNGGRDRCAVKE